MDLLAPDPVREERRLARSAGRTSLPVDDGMADLQSFGAQAGGMVM